MPDLFEQHGFSAHEPPQPEAPKYSTQRGFAHAFILFLCAVIASAVVAAVLSSGAEAERAGQAVGPFVFFGGCAGFGISALHQSGRGSLGWALDAGVVAVCVVFTASRLL